MKKILIIDGSSLFFRAFYALPNLTNSKGFPTNAIYGFVTMLENAIEKIKPSDICVCFDLKGKTFRHEQFKDYKANRQKMPDELSLQFPLVRKILDAMNIRVLESSKFEADDLAGSLSKLSENAGYECVLLTGDKDYFQLISEKIKVLLTRKGITELEVFDEEKLFKEYSLSPTEFIDLKGLMGDQSDNIPGVKGIGEKTGIKLLKEFSSIENIYSNLDKISAKSLKSKLEDGKALAFMSKKLATIIRDVPIDADLKDFEIKPYNLSELVKIYEEYEFYSFLKKLPLNDSPAKTDEISKSVEILDEYETSYLKKILKNKNFAFKLISEGKFYEGVLPSFWGLKTENEPPVFYKFSKESLLKFKEAFEREDIEILGHNLKEDLISLIGFGIDFKNVKYDLQIAEYIIAPEVSNYEIERLTQIYLNKNMKSLKEILGKGKTSKKLEEASDDVKIYLADLLDAIYKIKPEQEKKMDDKSKGLFYDVEMPLIEVLADMEVVGFSVDKSCLEDIGLVLDSNLKKLTQEIFSEAQEEFNINSPKQLGEILFEKLNFPVIKKTKTGYATGAEVLEKLAGQGGIIENILEYRKLSKLKSTYVDGLIKIINKNDSKIHSSFNQTVTATGRISSTEPNLQNIPIRTKEGRLIRKAFLPSENCRLIDADYSQIELRVLASVSDDKDMIEAFKHGEDIHASTAAQVFKVDIKDVDSELRSRAKAVNFGIVYGISDYGLSQNLNIPRQEAKTYIDNYLNHYKGIKAFMENIVKEGKEKGYVRTIFGRKRNIPELNNRNFNIRSFGERIALNTPIQGSAADIIKIAMVKVFQKLKAENLKSKLILQVHDELILDSPIDEIDRAKKILKDVMENAGKLKVDLLVDMEVLDNWYDAK